VLNLFACAYANMTTHAKPGMEEQKGGIFVGRPVPEVEKTRSTEDRFRSLNAQNVMAPPRIGPPPESENDVLLTCHAAESNDLPKLPEHARKTSVIEFDAKTADEIQNKLEMFFKEHECDIVNGKYKIDVRVLIGDELLKFDATLCSLLKSTAKKRTIGLHVRHLSGDRVTWFQFFTEMASFLGGFMDPGVTEFVNHFSNFGHLGELTDPQLSPDLEFIQGCQRMVASNYVESQLEGLKGLKLAIGHCAVGDPLSKSCKSSVEEALYDAADSKDRSVLRMTSEVLVIAAKAFKDDHKMSEQLWEKLKTIRREVAPKSLEKPDLETRRTVKNIKLALSLIPRVSRGRDLHGVFSE